MPAPRAFVHLRGESNIATGTGLAPSKLTMKLPVFLALAASALIVAPIVHAQPGVPRIPPAITQRAAQQNDVLFWYDRLPARHFAAFGNANRRELLKQKGAIYSAAQGYIEVPVPGDADKNDAQKLQVKLYRAQQGLVVAVSLNVWNQPRVPGTLALYGVTGTGTLRDVTKQLFPYQMEPLKDENGKVFAYANSVLPRTGTTITVSVPETDAATTQYLWNKREFVPREAPAAK